MVRALTRAQLEKMLNNIPKQLEPELDRATDENLTIVERKAKELIKVGAIYSKPPYDTGAMYDAVYTRKEKGSGFIVGRIAVDQPRNPESPNKYYPFFVVNALGYNARYGKRNFLWDAIRLKRTDIRNNYTFAVQRALKKISRGY